MCKAGSRVDTAPCRGIFGMPVKDVGAFLLPMGARMMMMSTGWHSLAQGLKLGGEGSHHRAAWGPLVLQSW